MRTNIDIDDELMAQAMEAGGFKTKREAVEEGLRLISRRKVYEGLLALRGKLQWDDSDEGWARGKTQKGGAMAINESKGPYAAQARTTAQKTKASAAAQRVRKTRSKTT